MRQTLLALFTALALHAQFTVGPLIAPASVTTGAPFTVSVPVGGNAGAGYQFTLALPSDAANVTVTAGTLAIAANKIADCGNSICLFYGVNSTLVQPGELARITLSLTNTGQHNVCIANPLAVDPNGVPIAVTPASFCVPVSVLGSKCDINGDGLINGADATLEASWVNGKAIVPAGSTCSRTGAATCTIADVEIVIKAARGEACIATQ